MLIKRIDKWFSKFKPFLFAYKDGFFELPFMANSPQVMFDSFKKMPFVKYDAAHNAIASKTPFLNTTIYYHEIEEGLLVLVTDVIYKTNVNFKHCYDNSFPSEYYCLSLRIDHSSKPMSNLIKGGINYTDNSWLLFKPLVQPDNHHLKGTHEKYFAVYFTHKWLKKHPLLSTNEMNLFIHSNNEIIICPHLTGNNTFNYEPLWELLTTPKKRDDDFNKVAKEKVIDLVSFFNLKMKTENITEKHFAIDNLARVKVLTAEKILQSYLFKKFPGIEFVAQKTGLSETKLKECFKIIYDATLFQYFQALQMEKAKELILNRNLKITDVADKLGYKNPSKFSAAFKKHFDLLPSEI